MGNLMRKVLRRPRRATAVLSVGLLSLFGGPFMQQCAPPPPDYSGVGHIDTYMSTNGISGGVKASAVQANGYTQIRSECTYLMHMPPGHNDYWITTLGDWVNPPDGNPNYPEATRVDSRCRVPSVSFLPAGAWPELHAVNFALA